MGKRSLLRAVTVTVLVPAAMNVGCHRSPAGPTQVFEFGPTVASVSPTTGPSDLSTEIHVGGRGFVSGATLTLGGVTAAITSIGDFVIVARTPAHAPGTVDVVVTNPDGQSSRLSGGYTFEFFSVAASPSLVAPGDELTVTWVAPAGKGCNGGGDWIAIYPVGAPDITGAANGHSNLWYTHLCGAASGTATLSAPSQAGEYEFRYMIGDTAAARSTPITVTATPQ